MAFPSQDPQNCTFLSSGQTLNPPTFTGKRALSSNCILLCQLGPRTALLGTKSHKGFCKNHILSLCLGPLYSEDWDLNLGNSTSSEVSSTSPSSTFSSSPLLWLQGLVNNILLSGSSSPQAHPGKLWSGAQMARAFSKFPLGSTGSIHDNKCLMTAVMVKCAQWAGSFTGNVTLNPHLQIR